MGGGIGMGNTCKPMAVSFQCKTKFTTNKKKKKRWANSGSCPSMKIFTFITKKKKKMISFDFFLRVLKYSYANFL